ncbi:MAG: UDP-N-acetylglucosamine 1-carboxyvinyltransferase [Patescibacteria group bacterium]
MSSFVIEGAKELHGIIEVPGAKNAVTPILAACLMTADECTIHNVPAISDVEKMLKLLGTVGAQVKHEGKTVIIKAENVNVSHLPISEVKGMRSSVLLFGPLLARIHSVTLPEPGGCIIGNRPLDTHLSGLQQLGVKVTINNEGYLLQSEQLKGAKVILSEFSVTATENIVMAATLATGVTIIELAAAEPHVQDLCNFLVDMGAKIKGIGTHTLTIEGVDYLHGAEYTIIPDPIEAGTWAVLAAVTRGEITIKPVHPEHLDFVLMKLKQIGVDWQLNGDALTVHASRQLKPFRLQALPYPGFPTDLQAPFCILATQANGTSLIHDPMYEGRLNHISELIKMGANAVVADPHRVVVTGPTPLYGRDIRSYDLRSGATVLIAALMAQGVSTIAEAEVVDRGYEKIERRLKALGAVINRQP